MVLVNKKCNQGRRCNGSWKLNHQTLKGFGDSAGWRFPVSWLWNAMLFCVFFGPCLLFLETLIRKEGHNETIFACQLKLLQKQTTFDWLCIDPSTIRQKVTMILWRTVSQFCRIVLCYIDDVMKTATTAEDPAAWFLKILKMSSGRYFPIFETAWGKNHDGMRQVFGKDCRPDWCTPRFSTLRGRILNVTAACPYLALKLDKRYTALIRCSALWTVADSSCLLVWKELNLIVCGSDVTCKICCGPALH